MPLESSCETRKRDRRSTKDSKERDKFVQALVNFTVLKDNMGFTPNEFFDFLDEQKIPAKSRKLINGQLKPNRRNDFLETTQKAAQDWGILYFYDGKKPNTTYYVDDRTARFKKLAGRRPLSCVVYSGSKRGFSRRLKTKKNGTVENYFKVSEKIETQHEKGENQPENIVQEQKQEQEQEQKMNNQISNIANDMDKGQIEELGDIQFDDVTETTSNSHESHESHVAQDELNNMEISLATCLLLQDDVVLPKFAYENRFYFVTTFLMNEKLIKDLSPRTTYHLRTNELLLYKEQLQEKYNTRQQNDSIKIVDEYVGAMFKSFEYPLAVSKDLDKLSKYYLYAGLFTFKKDKCSNIESLLKNNVPVVE